MNSLRDSVLGKICPCYGQEEERGGGVMDVTAQRKRERRKRGTIPVFLWTPDAP